MFKGVPRSRFHVSSIKALKKATSLLFCDINSRLLKDKFEQAFQNYTKRKYCIAVSTCRIGIYYSLKSLDLKSGDEVLIPAINIPDVINSIICADLTPSFIDLNLEGHCACLESIKKSITPRTKVLILTHLSGIVASDLEEITTFCNKNKIIIIEDFSQCMLSSHQEKIPGKIGLLSVCSLSNGKPISTMIGGAILTDDAILRDRILKLYETKRPLSKLSIWIQLFELLLINTATNTYVFNFFTFYVIRLVEKLGNNSKEAQDIMLPTALIDSEGSFPNKPILRSQFPKSFFFELCDWQFELGLWCLKIVEQGNTKRRFLAERLLSRLSIQARKNLPKDLFNLELNTFYHVPIYSEEPAQFKAFMKMNKIDCCGYGLSLNSYEKCFENFTKSTPNAKYIKENCCFIPLHESFSEKQIEHISDVVNSYFEFHA